MRIFFNLNKDKKNIDSNKIMKDIEKIKKDKYREFSDSFYFKSPIGDGVLLYLLHYSILGFF